MEKNVKARATKSATYFAILVLQSLHSFTVHVHGCVFGELTAKPERQTDSIGFHAKP